MKIHRVRPCGQGDLGAGYSASPAREEVHRGALTADTEVSLDRAQISDAQKHRWERAYDSRSLLTDSGEERFELGRRISHEAPLEQDQRKPVVTDPVALIFEQLDDPALAILTTFESRQIEEMKRGIAVVGNP